ncbi:MAG: CHAT domain-containing protein [Myxococcales bacterium]|nr:CHAT domain-containing protein [Myxococcales bacterium]
MVPGSRLAIALLECAIWRSCVAWRRQVKSVGARLRRMCRGESIDIHEYTPRLIGARSSAPADDGAARARAMTGALALVLELTRTDEPDDPHAFQLRPQAYSLRTPGGGRTRFEIAWDPRLLADLGALRQPGSDPALRQRLGDLLRRALAPAGWERLGDEIRSASEAGRPVLITLRSNAAELYALPWELLAVGASGQHLGELPGVLLRHEWPGTTTVAERPSPRPEGGRVLFAWSAAGGAVPAAEHQRALASAWAEGFMPFDAATDVLAGASARRLAEALTNAEAAGEPVTILHLLCHGGRVGSTFGLVLDGEVVDAGQLRRLLAPHAGTLRLVVLAACDGGNTGELGNHLGSVAQALHRTGIQSVVASRFPLSIDGSIVLTEALYRALLVELQPLERAFTEARGRLARLTEHLDWASLQLYAREADGDDTRPVVFCPYRGLSAFEPEHRRFFFGREREHEETLGDMQALIDTGRPRFMVVYGESGTGKSSIVLAGVVPDVGRLRPTRSGAWCVLTMRPGSAALAELELKLADAPADRPLLLVIDQFEEVFTQTEDPAERIAFVRRLWSDSQADTGLHVVASLRVDFLGRCGDLVLDDTGLALDAVAYDEDHRVAVPRMGPQQIRRVLERPAERVGLRFAPGLVDRILADVGTEPGALPLLQYALEKLWEARVGNVLSATVYEAMGGLAGALERDANELVEHLPAAEQAQVRRLLVRLVDTRDDEAVDTRRRVELARVQPSEAAPRAEFEAVLDRLVEARLVVRTSADHGATRTLEIAHEALIRRWSVLRRWVGEDREKLAEHERLRVWAEHQSLLTGVRLERALEFIREHGDDVESSVRAFVEASAAERQRVEAEQEAQRRRRRRAVIGVITSLSIGVLGMTGVSIYAFDQRADAFAAREEASRERDTAQTRLDQAVKVTKTILHDVLPKLERHPEARSEAKEILVLLQGTLRELGVTEEDYEARREIMVAHGMRGDEALHTDNVDVARAEYLAALEIAEELAEAQPQSVRASRDLSLTLDILGGIEVEAGDLARARELRARALVITEELAKAEPSSHQLKRDLVIRLDALGEVEVEAGDLARARELRSRALELVEELARADPGSAEIKRDLAVSLGGLADLAVLAGDVARARELYARGLAIHEELLEASPDDAQPKRDVAISLHQVGDVAVEAGDIERARELYARALTIVEELADADPHSARAKHDLTVSLGKLGDVELEAGDVGRARELLARSVALREELAEADPRSAAAKRGLAVSLNKMGDVEVEAGELGRARELFARSVALKEELAAADPSSAMAKRDLSVSLNNLGKVEALAGDVTRARELYARSLGLREDLKGFDPKSALAKRDLFVSLTGLADVEVRAGDVARARELYARALAALDELVEADPSAAGVKRDRADLLEKMGDIEAEAGDRARARELKARALALREELSASE